MGERRRICPHAEKGSMPEGELAGKSADQIPCCSEGNVHQKENEEMEKKALASPKGNGDHDHEGQKKNREILFHKRDLPKRPEGFTSSTPKKRSSPIASL